MVRTLFDPQAPQSEQKLQIYSYYLEVYSGILLPQKHVNEIHVYDLMAGEGTYNGTHGSAMRALNICEVVRKKHGKEIHLHLNEKDPERYRTLCKNINPADNSWVTCEDKDVNDAVTKHCSQNRDSYKLFFLDPFGYTQVNKESIDLIVRERKSECLLFVPVANIFRYVAKDAPPSEQQIPIAEFFKQFHIDASQYKNARGNEWVNIIRDALKSTYFKQYVGACRLDAGSNVHGLYFLGNHIYGLDRFLDAAQSNLAKRKNLQLTLFPSNDAEILSYLSEWRTNKELYEWVLRQNWSVSETRKSLGRMESQRRILVENAPQAPLRKKDAFYLSHLDYKDKTPVRITVKSSHHGD